MKKPRLDRGPKLNKAIAQPQAMTTSGVRQEIRGAALRSPVVTDMQTPLLDRDSKGDRVCRGEPINAFAWKSQPARPRKFSSHCSVTNRGGEIRQIKYCPLLTQTLNPS